MGRRSSIDDLPDPVRESVDRAIARGVKLDDIVAMVNDMGEEVTRSAVGRRAKNYRQMADQQRNVMAIAKAFGEDFGDSNNDAGKLLIQLVNSVAVRAMIPLASGEEPNIDGKELHFLARTAKDLLSAAKIDADRDSKIRDDERRKNAAAAEAEGRAAGASDETIERIKRKILGV
jgi:hypothetical protein